MSSSSSKKVEFGVLIGKMKEKHGNQKEDYRFGGKKMEGRAENYRFFSRMKKRTWNRQNI